MRREILELKNYVINSFQLGEGAILMAIVFPTRSAEVTKCPCASKGIIKLGFLSTYT